MKENLIGIYPNLSRAYEIAKLGDLSITVLYTKREGYSEIADDYIEIKKVYSDISFVPDGDIFIEIIKPRDYIYGRYCETINDIHKRVDEAKRNVIPDVFANTACDELLKNAVDKLKFSLKDFELIKKIAGVIGQLDGNDKIEAHHVAEAIHYRISVRCDNYDEYVMADNAVLMFGNHIKINQAGLDDKWGDEEKNIKNAIKYLKSLL